MFRACGSFYRRRYSLAVKMESRSFLQVIRVRVQYERGTGWGGSGRVRLRSLLEFVPVGDLPARRRLHLAPVVSRAAGSHGAQLQPTDHLETNIHSFISTDITK